MQLTQPEDTARRYSQKIQPEDTARRVRYQADTWRDGGTHEKEEVGEGAVPTRAGLPKILPWLPDQTVTPSSCCPTFLVYRLLIPNYPITIEASINLPVFVYYSQF